MTDEIRWKPIGEPQSDQTQPDISLLADVCSRPFSLSSGRRNIWAIGLANFPPSAIYTLECAQLDELAGSESTNYQNLWGQLCLIPM
jgi:hypothetical protein